MLSVMVILLSEMNSYRMRVAIAVLSPSSAPCLVFALKTNQRIVTFILTGGGRHQRSGQVSHLLSTVLSMNPFSLYWKSSWAVSSLASPPGDTPGYGISLHTCSKAGKGMGSARSRGPNSPSSATLVESLKLLQ